MSKKQIIGLAVGAFIIIVIIVVLDQSFRAKQKKDREACSKLLNAIDKDYAIGENLVQQTLDYIEPDPDYDGKADAQKLIDAKGFIDDDDVVYNTEGTGVIQNKTKAQLASISKALENLGHGTLDEFLQDFFDSWVDGGKYEAAAKIIANAS